MVFGVKLDRASQRHCAMCDAPGKEFEYRGTMHLALARHDGEYLCRACYRKARKSMPKKSPEIKKAPEVKKPVVKVEPVAEAAYDFGDDELDALMASMERGPTLQDKINAVKARMVPQAAWKKDPMYGIVIENDVPRALPWLLAVDDPDYRPQTVEEMLEGF